MSLTREEALQEVQAASKDYVRAQEREHEAHQRLKFAIRAASWDAKQIQETIAEATTVNTGEGNEFRLSRQRISQIVNE